MSQLLNRMKKTSSYKYNNFQAFDHSRDQAILNLLPFSPFMQVATRLSRLCHHYMTTSLFIPISPLSPAPKLHRLIRPFVCSSADRSVVPDVTTVPTSNLLIPIDKSTLNNSPPISFTNRPRSETRCRATVKRKLGLLVAYEGSQYHGLQRNRDVLTVSDTLESALHAAGAISDDNLGALEKIQWQVAARTDRGVSAAGNLVSAKLLLDRVQLATDPANVLTTTTQRINDHLPCHVRLLGLRNVTGSFSARASCDERWYEYLLPIHALGSSGAQLLPDFAEKVRQYEGTHYFHNFTVGPDHVIPPRDQARRLISCATVDALPITLPGAQGQWARVRVRGQSFILHQIRKMIALALLSLRGDTTSDAVTRALRPDVLINIPPAPALGLFLDCVHFGWYNERHRDRLPQPLSLAPFESARELFKMEQILPVIAKRFNEEEDLQVFFKTAADHPIQFD